MTRPARLLDLALAALALTVWAAFWYALASGGR